MSVSIDGRNISIRILLIWIRQELKELGLLDEIVLDDEIYEPTVDCCIDLLDSFLEELEE